MYVRLMIKGQQVAMMVDTGATHSFLEERIVHRLDLKVDKNTSRMKAVNSQLQAVTSMAHSVKISMGDWEWKIDLMLMPLDDFDLIPGREFFISAKIIIMPHLCGLMVTTKKNPFFVAGYNATTAGKRTTQMLSAMQVAHGLKKGRLTYLASLVEVESKTIDDGPFEVVKRVDNVAYRLQFLERLRVHLTFHVTFFKPFLEDSVNSERTQARRAPPVVQKQFDQEIEKVLEHRVLG
ncbi:gag-asp_proteas domain-containing protein [Cephalotus follicularis]|uniref:Gag-asp_proteas domain-containing protein n=1 Tax=Cephalotus follicularis TaxID=3775 RepID=A0A1Q3BDT2_CEPFO|nr:gag-asp_proteas domain-containing protein [Cephalotus follicularis]